VVKVEISRKKNHPQRARVSWFKEKGKKPSAIAGGKKSKNWGGKNKLEEKKKKRKGGKGKENSKIIQHVKNLGKPFKIGEVGWVQGDLQEEKCEGCCLGAEKKGRRKGGGFAKDELMWGKRNSRQKKVPPIEFVWFSTSLKK